MDLKTSNFEEIVVKNTKPVLVDFWAPWCGPCRMLGPIVERLSEEFAGRVDCVKVNVDEEQELAERFRVMSIPTIFIYKNGEIVERLVGARPYDELKEALEKLL